MDYEKKYKEALKKLQESLAPKDGREISGLTRGCIESIFPELKESEDERIRKELIELLLKDLSARLPYGVICNTPEGDGHLCSIIQTIFGIEYGINIKATERDYFNDKEVCIKPYLRPMSSMTEEERKEYELLANRCIINSVGFIHFDAQELISWLLKNHFDYNYLIPKNLAIEVAKENNPYKD